MIYKYVLKIVILDYFFVLFFNFQNRIFRFISDKYQQSHGKCFLTFKIVVKSEEDMTLCYSRNIDFMI